VELVGILKWPLVVVLLASAALWYLLPEIRSLIARINRLKFKDAEASADQAAVSAQAVIETPNAASGGVVGPHPFEVGDNPYALAVGNQIKQSVGSMTFQSSAERDRWLFREEAKLAIALDFERIYRSVWGSQMNLLATANQPGGAALTLAQQQYGAAAAAAPYVYGNYPFAGWLGYLENCGLVQRDAATVSATDKGRLFIQYLVGLRYDLHGARPDL
jgi:hypothetical protein